MIVTLKLCGLLGILIVFVLGFGHNIWAGFFSESSVIIKSFASFTPLLTISIVLDALQGVLSGWKFSSFDISSVLFTWIFPFPSHGWWLRVVALISGVARGCGWQHIAVYLNLTMFYFVGMTVAALLAFKANLYAKVKICCSFACLLVHHIFQTHIHT